MTKNPILDELHDVRERLLTDAGGTLDAQSNPRQRGLCLGNGSRSGASISRVPRCRRLDCSTFWLL